MWQFFHEMPNSVDICLRETDYSRTSATIEHFQPADAYSFRRGNGKWCGIFFFSLFYCNPHGLTCARQMHNCNVEIRLHMKINGHFLQLSPNSIVAENHFPVYTSCSADNCQLCSCKVWIVVCIYTCTHFMPVWQWLNVHNPTRHRDQFPIWFQCATTNSRG